MSRSSIARLVILTEKGKARLQSLDENEPALRSIDWTSEGPQFRRYGHSDVRLDHFILSVIEAEDGLSTDIKLSPLVEYSGYSLDIPEGVSYSALVSKLGKRVQSLLKNGYLEKVVMELDQQTMGVYRDTNRDYFTFEEGLRFKVSSSEAKDIRERIFSEGQKPRIAGVVHKLRSRNDPNYFTSQFFSIEDYDTGEDIKWVKRVLPSYETVDREVVEEGKASKFENERTQESVQRGTKSLRDF